MHRQEHRPSWPDWCEEGRGLEERDGGDGMAVTAMISAAVTVGAGAARPAILAAEAEDSGGGNGLLAIAVVALVALAVVWLFSSGRGRSAPDPLDGSDLDRDRSDDRQQNRGAAGNARALSSRLRNQQGTLDEMHRALGELIRRPDLDPHVERHLSRMYNQVDHLMFDTRESYREADELAQRLQR